MQGYWPPPPASSQKGRGHSQRARYLHTGVHHAGQPQNLVLRWIWSKCRAATWASVLEPMGDRIISSVSSVSSTFVTGTAFYLCFHVQKHQMPFIRHASCAAKVSTKPFSFQSCRVCHKVQEGKHMQRRVHQKAGERSQKMFESFFYGGTMVPPLVCENSHQCKKDSWFRNLMP